MALGSCFRLQPCLICPGKVRVLACASVPLSSLVAQTVKSVYNAGDLGSIPGLGRSPGEGNGNPLQD